jgi:hypothetical protein
MRNVKNCRIGGRDNTRGMNKIFIKRIFQTKVAKIGSYEFVLKKYIILLILSMLFIAFNFRIQFVLADETDPYNIYGTIKDENRIPIEGVLITITNLNTQEANSNGNDTITGNPIIVVTDSEGRYTFEVLNLKSGYSIGDEIQVTVEQDGIIGSKSIIISEGDWGARIDIILVTGESQDNESWFGNTSNIWVLLIIVIFIVLIFLFYFFNKRKPKDVLSTQVKVKKKSPLFHSRSKSKDKLVSVNEDEKETNRVIFVNILQLLNLLVMIAFHFRFFTIFYIDVL